MLAQRLEAKPIKSGISPSALPPPEEGLQSLPPILRMISSDSVPSCSKAPRGLFVLVWVTGICTGISISPSHSLRQRPSCYTIRAGRNLPDKGLRYLRTVIVTAAAYRGFGLELRCLTPPLNLPALGRYQPVYLGLRLEHRPVFLLNSHLDHFSVIPTIHRDTPSP